MAIFTAIATAIVEYAIGAAVTAGTWAAFAVSVVATGLAAVTARLTGVGRRGGSGTRDQGVRIQLPPSTENKVPIVYGTAYQQGVITDARISNSNKTMTYVLILSEKTQTGTWTCDEIYWNDERLVFKVDGYTVDKSIQSDGAENTNLNGLVRVWVYAGGTESTYQIKGPSPAVNAYDTLGDDNLYQLRDLVFAVVQLVEYNSDKGVTGLPTMTFKINNSLKNPASVWYDFMTASRYGAGFTATEINTVTSINTVSTTSLYSISQEIPQFQYDGVSNFLGSVSGTTLTVDKVNTGTISVGYRLAGSGVINDNFISSLGSGTGGTGTYNLSVANTLTTRILGTVTGTNQVRYEINGVLNTGDTVKTNMEKINLASASWTTYNYKNGQWQIVVNRGVSGSEIAASYEFNDDNIIGEINLTSSNLEDLYNEVEVGFASRAVRDQSDYFRYNLPSSELNTLEPVNKLQMQMSLVNNPIHAGRLGLLELNQNRYDLLISFTADYGALVCEVGDVVRVSNPIYGFDKKLFRITRIRETEGEDGTIAAEITALEYNAGIYADTTLTNLTYTPLSGIPSQGSSSGLPAPSAPTVPSQYDFAFNLQTTINSGSLPVDEVQFYYSSTSTSGFQWLITVPATGQFYANDTVNATYVQLDPGDWYFKARTRLGENYSELSSSSAVFTWAPTYPSG